MSAPDPQIRITQLERELHWAQLKIQVLEERLRQQRIRMLGPQSETLSNLQLELLADEEPGVTAEEVEAESRRDPVQKMPPRERKPHPGRERLPENLRRVEKVILCPEQTCRSCGRKRRSSATTKASSSTSSQLATSFGSPSARSAPAGAAHGAR